VFHYMMSVSAIYKSCINVAVVVLKNE